MLKIQRAAVIGAGTMGAGIAAQLANAGIPTLLLDLPGTDERSSVARQGLERAKKARPAAFMHPQVASLIHVGNTEDDLARLAHVDWVIEAVIEKLEAKQDLLAKLETVVGPHTIVSSNSSGIPMKYQAAKLSPEMKKRFLGTHFFNPPRYLHLLEIIPTADTNPAVVASVREFADRVLGKGIVTAHDVPGFAANRIGVFCSVKSIQAMVELGLTPDVVDALTGPLLGRPKSATFRTADMVGLDIVATVASQLQQATKEGFDLPPVIATMMEKKMLGDKTGQGFYKKVKSEGKTQILALNLETLEYEARPPVKLAELAPIVALPTVAQRVAALLDEPGKAGEFTRRSLIPQIHFAAQKVGEVAATAEEVDNALKWGFNWEIGPLELAEELGRQTILKHFEAQNLIVPAYFNTAPPQAKESGILNVRSLRKGDHAVLSNKAASLLDMGDGVALLEFHGKANAIGEEVLELMEQAHERVTRDFQAMVVGNEGENFCAGADLGMLLRLSQEQDWEAIRAAVKIFQGMTTRLRYSSYPVVVAPHHVNLGGGCEVALWGDCCVAGAELYTGLVEVGVGILPAGGGTTEMLLRMNERLLPGADPFVAVQEAFQLIAMAKVSTSALEARAFGFLREHDQIVMNPDRLLSEAKIKALSLVPGYHPPARRRVKALGETALANLRAGAYLMHQSGQITEYEVHLAGTVGAVLTGGSLNRPDEVSEELLLELEGEAFLHLSGQQKTRDRMAHTLKTGKTLRN